MYKLKWLTVKKAPLWVQIDVVMLTSLNRTPWSQLCFRVKLYLSVLSVSGRIQTVPIGYISSCFAVKNGTPRQPTICSSSRASLKIEPSVFNNPEHSLVGLEQYSHIWYVANKWRISFACTHLHCSLTACQIFELVPHTELKKYIIILSVEQNGNKKSCTFFYPI